MDVLLLLLFSKPPSESRFEYETKTTHMTCLKQSCACCSSIQSPAWARKDKEVKPERVESFTPGLSKPEAVLDTYSCRDESCDTMLERRLDRIARNQQGMNWRQHRRARD